MIDGLVKGLVTLLVWRREIRKTYLRARFRWRAHRAGPMPWSPPTRKYL